MHVRNDRITKFSHRTEYLWTQFLPDGNETEAERMAVSSLVEKCT